MHEEILRLIEKYKCLLTVSQQKLKTAEKGKGPLNPFVISAKTEIRTYNTVLDDLKILKSHIK